MPTMNRSIEETTTHITDVVCHQIVTSLLDDIGVYSYFKDNIQIKHDYTLPSNTSDKNHRANITDKLCEVDVDAMFNPFDTKWEKTTFWNVFSQSIYRRHLDEDYPLFIDPDADVFMTDKRAPFSALLTISLQTRDREIAYKIYDNTMSKLGGNMTMDYRMVAYDYPINNDIFYTLHEIYKLRTSVNKKMSFYDYMRKGSQKLISLSQSTRNGSSEVVVKYSQADVLGQPEVTSARPEAVKEGDAVVGYIVTFSYAFQFMRPVMHFLQFPATVENQLVPGKVIVPSHQSNKYFVAGISKDAIARWVHSNSPMPEVPIRIPFYDDWRLTTFHPLGKASNYLTIAIMNFLLDDTDDDITSFNIRDVFTSVGCPVREDVLTFIKKQGVYNTLVGPGLIKIAVFSNDIAIEPSRITIDDDLTINVYAKDKVKRYHFVLSIAVNEKVLSGDVIKIIKDNPDIFDLDDRKGEHDGYHPPLRLIAARIIPIRDDSIAGH